MNATSLIRSRMAAFLAGALLAGLLMWGWTRSRVITLEQDLAVAVTNGINCDAQLILFRQALANSKR